MRPRAAAAPRWISPINVFCTASRFGAAFVNRTVKLFSRNFFKRFVNEALFCSILYWPKRQSCYNKPQGLHLWEGRFMDFLRLLEGLRNPFFNSVFSFLRSLTKTLFMVIAMTIFWCIDKSGYFLLLCELLRQSDQLVSQADLHRSTPGCWIPNLPS